MPALDLDELEETRRSVCNNCEHYNRKGDSCTFIQLRTGKKGLMKHHNGIRNPKSRCPYFYERKWGFIPSLWPWEINRLIMVITPQEVYEYTKAHHLSPYAIMNRVYAKAEKEGFLPPRRSYVLSQIRALNAIPNEYQHVEYLNIDYLTGELSQ